MFSSQLGRTVARSGTNVAAHSTMAPAAHRTSAAVCLSQRQRRLSSSKASCPPNNGESKRAAQSPQQASAPSTASKPAVNAGKKGARKMAKEAKDKHEGFEKLPRVNPTDHLRASDITVSSFFGMHRPLSLNATFPPQADMHAFNSIFESKSKSKSPQDVIYTLSSAISNLDSPPQSDMRWEIVQENQPSDANVQHLDGVPRAKSLEELVGQLRPFTAPPPPVPAGTVSTKPAARTASSPTSQKSFKTTIIVTEKTAADGHKYYTAQTTPMEPIKEPKRQPLAPFKDRMRQRQMGRSEEAAEMGKSEEGEMLAISVKRQRKLKMKKHKYKKLMKRTRNLRRRLDRN